MYNLSFTWIRLHQLINLPNFELSKIDLKLYLVFYIVIYDFIVSKNVTCKFIKFLFLSEMAYKINSR